MFLFIQKNKIKFLLAAFGMNSMLAIAGPSYVSVSEDTSLADSPAESLDLNKFKVLASVPQSQITNKDVQLIIPMDIAAGSEPDLVSKKIMDKSLNSLLSGKLTPNNEVFQKVKEVEQAMQYDLAFKPSDSDIAHSFNLQYLPFQQSLKVKYSGLLDAKIVFASNDSLDAELSKKISKSASIVLAHQEIPMYRDNQSVVDSSSSLNMRWSY